MEVKVGQVWVINNSGSLAEIIAVDSECACINRIGCYPCSGFQIFMLDEFEDFKLIQEPDNFPSDLEIVQRALESLKAWVMINHDGLCDVMYETGNGIDEISFNSAFGLLTWAKQTVGHE